MPRFVILTHDHPFMHWDFFLEQGEVLRGWRLAHAPALELTIPATAQADHRKLYLDYEGPVSGDRGTVLRWDAGTFEWIEQRTHFVTLQITGKRIRGRVELKHVSEDNWLCNFLPLHV
jgi:hypothetical protein